MQLAREVQPADHRVHRHAGGVSGHRVGGARRRRGDRRQPARDDDARRADHRHRQRRRRQRRRARHRDRRSRADAGVRDLQRHPAGRLRGDPVARRRTGKSRPRPRSRSPRPTCSRSASSTRSSRSRPAARTTIRRRDRAGRPGAVGGARRRVRRCRSSSGSTARYEKFRSMGEEGSAFVDATAARARAERRGLTARSHAKSLLWQHLPCDEAADDRAGCRARSCSPIVARLLCLRGLSDPERRRGS